MLSLCNMERLPYKLFSNCVAMGPVIFVHVANKFTKLPLFDEMILYSVLLFKEFGWLMVLQHVLVNCVANYGGSWNFLGHREYMLI